WRVSCCARPGSLCSGSQKKSHARQQHPPKRKQTPKKRPRPNPEQERARPGAANATPGLVVIEPFSNQTLLGSKLVPCFSSQRRALSAADDHSSCRSAASV